MKLSLFELPSNNKRITGKIIKNILPGWWVVEDPSGKRYRVASDQSWRGGTTVAVVGGQIVGKAGEVNPSLVFEV
jgi:hypothetical protein